MFKKATKKKAKLRLAIEGASGSGKTYSSLILAKELGKKIAVLDTEHGSASLYSDLFDFDVLELKPPYTPESYINAINEAEKAGYEVLVIDSITHEWNGVGGCLDIVSNVSGNSYTAWAKVTPRHDAFVNRMLNSSIHIIATMRSKANYETGKADNGKMTLEKKGTAPIQREGIDYEFTIVFDLNHKHNATATKDRTGMFDKRDFIISDVTGKELVNWLNSGVEVEDNGKQAVVTDDKQTKKDEVKTEKVKEEPPQNEPEVCRDEAQEGSSKEHTPQDSKLIETIEFQRRVVGLSAQACYKLGIPEDKTGIKIHGPEDLTPLQLKIVSKEMNAFYKDERIKMDTVYGKGLISDELMALIKEARLAAKVEKEQLMDIINNLIGLKSATLQNLKEVVTAVDGGVLLMYLKSNPNAK